MDKTIETNTLCLGSYNLCATFFCDPKDEKDPKSSMPSTWEKRKNYFRTTLLTVNCDIMGLQELSPEQAIDFINMFPEYKFYFFVQAQTDQIQSGSIYTNSEEIKQNLLGKNIGTPLIGIMYNPLVLVAKKTGMFWYNPKPYQRPLEVDRSLTDKGYGNMNTPRGPGYVHFFHILSGKEFYFFTSHAPISGGSETRKKCFELENKVIPEIVGSLPFFSVGDRNLLPDQGDLAEEAYNALVPVPVPGPDSSNDHLIYDWLNEKNHEGFMGTWLGYLYEPVEFQTQIQPDGSLRNSKRFDVGTSSLKSFWSAHYHCIIKENGVQVLGKLTEKDNLTRNFLSDHSMVVAKFHI